jgi:hypothetical protein
MAISDLDTNAIRSLLEELGTQLTQLRGHL